MTHSAERDETESAARVLWALTTLGVDPATAADLLWIALENDPTFGLERAQLQIRLWCGRQLATVTRSEKESEQAETLARASALIRDLSDRCAALTEALQEVHARETRALGVAPLRTVADLARSDFKV